jgi:hypothetical protein
MIAAVQTILSRLRIEVNTDPQRRCYHGVHAKSELQWTDWTVLEYVSADKIKDRLKFWLELNDIAVKDRGEVARREFKLGDATELLME